MPVIWCGNEDGIEGRVFQQATQIARGLWCSPGSHLNILNRGGQTLLIHVADPRDLHIAAFAEQFQVIAAHATAANHSDLQQVV